MKRCGTIPRAPKPPSNAKGSDFAGTLFTFEWNLDFPTTGQYKFRGVRDNVAKLYVDNQFLADLGGFQSGGNEIKKYYEEGLHVVKVELLNKPIYETVTIDAYERQIPGVDFIQKSNGIYMTVGGNQEVDVSLSFEYDDNPDTAGTAATEIIVPNSPGRPDLVLKRKKKKGQLKKENIAYYTIPVDFEITGNFIGYIKFKRALSLSQKMLNFDKESIEVVKGDTTGAIKVKGTLTIVGLADDFF